MASPSIPSSSITTLPKKHEVFVSFRGEDTRHGFISHLYDALCQKKIETFIDDYELERGDFFGAIQGSKIAVVIFSENYASSRWCLRELAEIIKCRKMNKLIVMPVFYHVDPSDIRKQTGSFECSFANYKEKELKEEVQNWREVLTEASSLSGWDSSVIRPEAKLVSEIVESVWVKLRSEYMPSTSDFEGRIGIHKRIEHGGADGHRVGKLFVSNTEIAKGSNGTIVLEGIHEGRPVAVKRLVRYHHDDVAYKEILNLIESDKHPNIVRWYGKETDRDFVYLSLELCTCSLDDLIQMNSDSSHNSSLDEGQDTKAMTEYKLRLDSVKGIMQDLSLWKANGHPSPLLLKLMKDMVSGLVHLHKLRIVHRDLKPQNVLISTLYDIIDKRSLCAKLSDMGISKRLLADMSSLGHHATGCGTSGWQAPEQLLNGRQTRAVDLFSLGCVMYFCITRGRHPFGNRHERDSNIEKNQMNLDLVECIPEAEDLISCLLNPDPQLRPSANEVLHHPLFWSSDMRLSFVRDTSDMVELEWKKTYSALLEALENTASVAQCTKWNEKLEPIFINNIGHYQRRSSYRFDSIRDLLRVMRNKLNHYRELPKEVQELVGPVPEGFDGYFATRFPRLLIEVYKVVCRYCREEECFQKYFKSDIL